MSLYRTVLAAFAAIAIAAPVFADDVTSTTTSTTEATSTVSEQTKVNLNQASVSDLMKVKGLNRSKAKAIVSYREKHGEFKTLDDLSKVKGFKKMKLETLKEVQDQLVITQSS